MKLGNIKENAGKSQGNFDWSLNAICEYSYLMFQAFIGITDQ